MLDIKVSLLIVDDDPLIRYSLSEIFRTMGHSVRTAEDGFYALQEMANAIPDVLISDLNMPRMSGFELLSSCGADFRQSMWSP
jgi:CheY-like chemotaxis protein